MPEDKTTQSAETKSLHEPWGAACAAAMEGNQQAMTRWMRALLALSHEVAQFTQTRLQEDAAAWSALAACRNPEEVMECHRRFSAKATEQYYQEISKLSQMAMQAAGEGLALPQRPTASP